MADVTFSADLETKEAIRNIARFSKESQAAVKNISSSFTALKGVAIAAVGVFAGGKLLGSIKSITAAAGVQEDAVKQLNTALALTGSFSEDASQDMQDFASAMQDTTAIGDETTIQMLALAKSFGVTNEGAKDLVDAAADLSAATGKSFESSVINLGKSLSGLSGELGESVGAIRELSAEQLKAGAAIDLISNRFGGSAAANAQTFSGAIEGLAGRFGDLQEELGFVITKNPAVIKVLKALGDSFKNLGSFVSDNQGEIVDFVGEGIESLLKNAPSAVKALSIFGKGVISLGRVFNATAGITSEFFRLIIESASFASDQLALLLRPINSIALAFGAVKQEAAEINLSAWENSLFRVNKQLAETTDEAKKIELRAQNEEILSSIKKVKDEIATIENVNEFIAKEIDDSKESIGETLAGAVSASIDNSQILDKLEIGIDSSGDLLISAMDGLAKSFDEASGAIGGQPRNGPGPAGFVGPTDPILVEGTDQFVGPSNVSPERRKELKQEADAKAKADEESRKSLLDSAAVAANAFTQGADGAATLLGAGAGAAADAFVPGLGGAVGPLVTALAEGGADGATSMVEGLVDALPGLLNNLIEAIPAFVLAIADNIDIIIVAIIKAIPNLIRAIIKAIPGIVAALGKALIRAVAEIGPEIGASLQEGLKAITEFNFAGFIAEGFNEGLSAFKQTVGAAGTRFIGSITDGVNVFGNRLSSIGTNITAPVDNLFTRFSSFDFGGVIQSSFSDAIQFIKDDFERNLKFWEVFFDGIVEFFDGFAEALIQFDTAIGGITSQFDRFQGFIDDFRDAFSTDGGGGVIGKIGGDSEGAPIEVQIIEGITGAFAATGGIVGGFGSSDNQAFALTPGELIVDRGRSQQIVDALDNPRQSDDAASTAILAKILEVLSAPQTVTTTAEIDGAAFADLILQLSRSNARLTA